MRRESFRRGVLLHLEELSDFLQGSGVAVLEFCGIVSWDTNYTLVTPHGREIGEGTLNWEGTLGIIEIAYDQGRISLVKYDVEAILLVMLPIQ